MDQNPVETKVQAVEELRVSLIRLAECQASLREALITLMNKNKWNRAQLAREIDVLRDPIDHLITNRQSPEAGLALEKIIEFLKKKAPKTDWAKIYQDIKHVGLNITRRSRTVSCLPKASIDLTCDLLSAAARESDYLTLKQFSELFGENSDLVFGCLDFSRESLDKLAEDSVSDAIFQTLCDDNWDTRLAETRQHVQKTLDDQKAAFNNLLAELRQYFESEEALATALGMKVSYMQRFRHKLNRRTDLSSILERASALLASKQTTPQADDVSPPEEKSVEEPTPAQEEVQDSSTQTHDQEPAQEEPAPLPETPASVADTFVQLLNAHGGETSVLGVPHALTAGSFTAVDLEPGRDLINTTTRHLRITRALLNLWAQLRDDEVRVEVMTTLGPEVEELYLTLKLFTFEFPNRLTEIYEQQRLQWLEQAKNQKQQKVSKRR